MTDEIQYTDQEIEDLFEVEQRFSTGDNESHMHWLDRKRNRRLKTALDRAATCDKYIEPEQRRILALLSEAQAKPNNETEIAARQYQFWYVDQYLNRAVRIARERIRYLRAIITAEQQKAETEKCRTDMQHWFKYYGWGYDPRARTALSTVPFELHPRQAELVTELDDVVFNRKTSLLIEKARDEGATELIVRWGIHSWTFREGFSMLLSSRTEDEVDTKKKLGTLFERARFQIRRLPDWMLDPAFDIEKGLLPDKLIAHPNGNALHGQAPVENMGRGDRVTCAMFDEFAFWRFGGYPQYTSMSQTTDSIIMPSSVAGTFNQFADLAFDGVTRKFEMDWRDNPFKTKAWFDALPYGYISPKMSRTSIAQEVERNYRASQPGKVWHYREELTFITMSEFMVPFIAKGMQHHFNNGGDFIIPRDWRVTRTNDFGKSEGHEWAHLVGAQPRANYPMADTHFIFLARNLEPTGISIQEAVAMWQGWEAELGLRDRITLKWVNNIKPHSYNSHEQDELRKVLLNQYGENWTAWNTDYETGITTIEDWLTPVEPDQPNPFRPQLMGRNRLVFVAPDSEYMLAHNDRLNQWFVTISETEAGFNTARKQMDAYHYPQSELGKPVKLMRPKKEFDDIIDCLVAGTLVLTARGEIAIEAVVPGDLVWTREGWKPVKDAKQTARQVSTYTLTNAEGRSITGTGNHKIFTANRGWVALRGLTVNDTLLSCPDPKRLSTTATHISVTQTRPERHTANTFIEPARRYMSRCGSVITDRYRRVIMSITRTMTPAITPHLTWSADPLLITSASTCSAGPSWPNAASIAGPNSRPKHPITAFVGLCAKNARAAASIASQLLAHVPGVTSLLPNQGTRKGESGHSTAREVAVRSLVKNAERQSVYNLNVADCHEYFANRILVANCIRGYSVNWNRNPGDLTPAETREAALPTNLQNFEGRVAANDPDAERVALARTMAFAEMDQRDAEKRRMMSKTRPSVPKVGLRRR